MAILQAKNSVVLPKSVWSFGRHSGQAGGSWRDPESRNFKGFCVPAFAGMTAKKRMIY
jgi:hypothetical protein